MFTNILGHEKQREQLSRAVAQNRLHHALIFSGIEGIGKKKIAFDLITALGCSQFDRHLIAPENKTINIDLIRNLKSNIFLHPVEGDVKAVVIDQAHTLTEASANALLKILEEPPQSTYFFLITHLPSRLLPTILSRCQQISFYPLQEDVLKKFLEKKGFDTGESKLRAKISQGSLKVALEFDAENYSKIQQEWFQLSQDPTPTNIITLAELWGAKETDLDFILQTLGNICHKQFLEKEDSHLLEREGEKWDAIQQALKSLERYPNRQLLVEDLLFQLTA